ncbi:MAG TPA: hypothetical protein VD926_02305, partial [Acidimicrobiales bacterium]|nr:hypothetical protein [Acidimicrobiales bacterium]
MLPTAERPRVSPAAPAAALRRPVVAVLVLLLAYAALLALGDSRTGSVSDVGGKLATAKVLAEGDGTTPDVGYWAEEHDPDGTFHALANTGRVGDRWVQATSVPYSLATGVLWRLGGPAGVAALSMAASVASALAARRIARHLGADRGGAAFWLVGLGGPLAVYALDGWEHAPGVALGLWGVALGLHPRTSTRAAAAGACFTAAITLRADLAVTTVAFGVATLAVADVRRRWTRHPSRIAAGVLGAAVPLLANTALEHLALGEGLRASRAGDGAAQAGVDLGQRVTDAMLTGFGLFADDSPTALLLGGLLLGALVVLAGRVAGRPWATDPLTTAATFTAVLLYALRLLDGLGFVPGALAAAPIAVLALAAHRRADTWVVLGTALGAVPLVWLLQWNGSHVPQWGGRYLLMSTALLTVVAAVALERNGLRKGPTPLLLGLTVVVTAMGLAWHVERTTIEGDVLDALMDQPADTVIVAIDGQLGRELGAGYGDIRWLSADEGSWQGSLAVAL